MKSILTGLRVLMVLTPLTVFGFLPLQFQSRWEGDGAFREKCGRTLESLILYHHLPDPKKPGHPANRRRLPVWWHPTLGQVYSRLG